MPRLTDFLRGYAPFEEIVTRANATGAAEAGATAVGAGVEVAAPTFVHAFLTAALLERRPWRDRTVLAVAANQEAASDLEHELTLYCPGRTVVYLPPRGVWYGSEGEVHAPVAGRRARAVHALRQGSPVLVVEATTLMEGVIPPPASPLTIEAGGRHEFDDLAQQLVTLGYTRVDQVEDAGDFSVRGGIIDVFPATEAHPVRV
ncbi:MAG: hypothetical protein JW990_08795, partial [Thermoleophilia bacterium]|nr:hypothetical protein [Thermoleophilia bacterium]